MKNIIKVFVTIVFLTIVIFSTPILGVLLKGLTLIPEFFPNREIVQQNALKVFYENEELFNYVAEKMIEINEYVSYSLQDNSLPDNIKSDTELMQKLSELLENTDVSYVSVNPELRIVNFHMKDGEKYGSRLQYYFKYKEPNGTIIVTKITEKWYYTQALHA